MDSNKKGQDKKSNTKLDRGIESLSSFAASKANEIGQKANTSVNEIVAILCFISSFVLFLSFVSMNPTDSSLLSTSFNGADSIKNLLGKFGASVSALSFSSVGLASYIIPAIFVWAGLNSIASSPTKTYAPMIAFNGILILIASVFLDFVLSQSVPSFRKGGIVGSVINGKLSSIAGSFGTFLAIITSSIFALLFASKSGVKDSIDNIKDFMSNIHKQSDNNMNKDNKKLQKKIFPFYRNNTKPENEKIYDVEESSVPIIDKKNVNPLKFHIVPFIEKVKVYENSRKSNERKNKFDFSERDYQLQEQERHEQPQHSENTSRRYYSPLDNNIFQNEGEHIDIRQNNYSYENNNTQERYNENKPSEYKSSTLGRDIASIIRRKIFSNGSDNTDNHRDVYNDKQESYNNNKYSNGNHISERDYGINRVRPQQAQQREEIPYQPQPQPQQETFRSQEHRDPQYQQPRHEVVPSSNTQPQQQIEQNSQQIEPPRYQPQQEIYPQPPPMQVEQPYYQKNDMNNDRSNYSSEQYQEPISKENNTSIVDNTNGIPRQIHINEYQDYDNSGDTSSLGDEPIESSSRDDWSIGYAKERPYNREDHFGHSSSQNDEHIDNPRYKKQTREIENRRTEIEPESDANKNAGLPEYSIGYAKERPYNREEHFGRIEPKVVINTDVQNVESKREQTEQPTQYIEPRYREDINNSIKNNIYGGMTESDMENINMYRRDFDDNFDVIDTKPTININALPKPATSSIAIDDYDYICSKIDEADISGIASGSDVVEPYHVEYSEPVVPYDEPIPIENEHIQNDDIEPVTYNTVDDYDNSNDSGFGYMELSTTNSRPSDIENSYIDTITKPPQMIDGKKVLKSKKKYDPDEFIQSNFDREYVDEHYKRPMLDLLKRSIAVNTDEINESIRQTAIHLENTLLDFSVEASVVSVSRGPVITRYELELATGTRVSKIVGLTDDIALALASESVRIIAPIPGRSVIGIEIPNKVRADVYLRDVLESKDFQNAKKEIPFVIGKGIYGNNVVTDLAEAPHLLVAGTTGSGKSVCLSTIILSFLFKFRPDELKFIFIDKKRVELSIYNGIPHLMAPVVSDEKKATIVLRHIVDIMESRYERMEKFFVRNVKAYNEKINQLLDNGETDFGGEPLELFPYIVVVIDELHNLMVVSSKEVEDLISRLAGMSRAVGIHLIIATQRPSADVVTGVIKANLPTRIAFQVPNKTNSRIIIDMSGAEQLLGKGDGLFCSTGSQVPERVQGSFVSDAEVKGVVDYLSAQMAPMYDANLIASLQKGDNNNSNTVEEIMDEELWDDAIDVVMRTGKASASFLQRKLKIGYNRAARIVELMEAQGYIGPENGSKPREVYIGSDNNN